LYNKIVANWCANQPSISPDQMIKEAYRYWQQYGGSRRLS
jgi:hypothetical protein